MKKNQGQSLIEIIVAVAVLGVALVSIVLTATVGLKASRVASERSYARHLVENELEDIRRIRDMDPTTFFSLGSRTDPPEDFGTAPVYTMTTVYTELVAQEQYEIEVEVSWEDGGNTYRVSQITYLSRWQ